jgi:3alpha(or 20beta)-hydroxysteroid dehydrogenase
VIVDVPGRAAFQWRRTVGKLDGCVAIITGGARGMGASHARAFVREGARVVVTDILENLGEAVAAELAPAARFIHADVTSESDWQRVVRETEATFGPVRILVNNAGVLPPVRSIEQTSEAEFRQVFETNAFGPFLGMKAVLPSMRKAGGGSIVNISSLMGLCAGGRGSIDYVGSKFALRGMTKAAALECASYGIRVNSVHPGLIRTPMIEDDAPMFPELMKIIPLHRIGDTDEVTNLVIFLASDDSSYCTGAEFVIDGGVYAQ